MPEIQQKIKIANVILENRICGPTRRILDIAVKLKENNIETIVIMPSGGEEFEKSLSTNGIRYYSVPLLRLRNSLNPIVNLRWLLHLRKNFLCILRILQDENIDIVHCNGLTQIVGGIAGRKAKAKVLWHLNDIAAPRAVRLIFKPVVHFLADKIVFASNAVKTHFGYHGEDNSDILFAPVDTRHFSPEFSSYEREEVRRTFSIPPNATVVGMVGNVNYLKGVPVFVASSKIISSMDDSVYFLHVGAKLDTKISLYEEIEKDCNDPIFNGKFVLAGKQNNVRKFLSAMDIFVIPSLSEACPITLLEAMSMEKTIIASNVGGIPELVTNHKEAFLVPPGDPNAIAQCIKYILENPDCVKIMEQQAREKATNYYDISICADSHIRFYKYLLGIN